VKVKTAGKEVDVSYEKSGSYHTYIATSLNVVTTGLNKDKCYAKFMKELYTAAINPNR
jgi:hypothetical protein